MTDADLERLVSQAQISNSDANMAHIVPHLCSDLIRVSKSQRSIKTRQCHIILPRIETAQSHIVPEFRAGHPTLNQSLVESERNLRLIRIEMVTGDTCNRLDRIIVEYKDLLVEHERLFGVIQHIVDSSDAYLQLRILIMLLQALRK